MGRSLSAELIRRGHKVRGLVRPGSENRVAPGCDAVSGNALDAFTYSAYVPPADTFVHLVGVSHPNPSKAAQFRAIDLTSALEAVKAARSSGVRHFVYVSVAHPAPVMRAYIAARSEAEDAIRASRLDATFIRPWYVLGPGRRWPLLLKPFYWVMESLPSTRETARRLGLVTLPQMIATLASAVEHPPNGIRIVEVPDIRLSRLESDQVIAPQSAP